MTKETTVTGALAEIESMAALLDLMVTEDVIKMKAGCTRRGSVCVWDVKIDLLYGYGPTLDDAMADLRADVATEKERRCAAIAEDAGLTDEQSARALTMANEMSAEQPKRLWSDVATEACMIVERQNAAGAA